MKAQVAEEREQMSKLQGELRDETKRCGELEKQLEANSHAQAEAQGLRLQLDECTQKLNGAEGESDRLRANAAELNDANKVLKINIDKLSRAQQEMLTKARKADDAQRALQSEKEAAEKALAASASKVAVQERQLKTFLQANEALETDLRKQLSRVAALERRKQEQEAEQQTIEAYYQARLEEMQAQYDRLLAEIDDAKRDAQVKVYKTFQDDAAVLPSAQEGGGGGTDRGLSAEGGTGLAEGSPRK